MTVSELIEALQSWKMPDADVKFLLGSNVLKISPKGGNSLELITDFPYDEKYLREWEDAIELAKETHADNEWLTEECNDLRDENDSMNQRVWFILNSINDMVKKIVGYSKYYSDEMIPKNSIFDYGNINERVFKDED